MSAAHYIITPYGRRDPSARARAFAWAERVRPGDTHVIVAGRGWRGAEQALRAALRPPSSVVVLRHISPFSEGLAERRVLDAARLGVYDLDDGLPWDDGRLDDHRGIAKRVFPKARIARVAAAAADRVIAGNDVLADWAAQRCHDVVVIPTCIEPADCEQKLGFEVPDRPVIGWIGSPATEPHLRVAAEALAEVHRRLGARLVVVSAGERLIDDCLDGWVERVEWNESIARTQLASWDVGIMPLPDTAYTRAKCGYKLLQYAAAALPAVGSPVGMSAQVLAATASPAPATTDEWVDALTERLTIGPEARREAGATARRAIVDKFSYEAWDQVWRHAAGLPPAGESGSRAR